MDKAREQVAKLIGCTPKEIIFHVGGDGVQQPCDQGDLRRCTAKKGNHIITQVTETQGGARYLQEAGAAGITRWTYLPVQEDGLISIDAFEGGD